MISLSSRTSVGRKISDGSDRETPDYRREWQEWQESIRQKGIDISRLWNVFGPMITIGS
jgi:hypothetical protein